MSENDGLEGLSGDTLRTKLVEALAEIRVLRSENIRLSPEFGLVQESDLKDLSVDQPYEDWKAKANEVQGQRKGDQEALLKKAGLTDEQVEAVMAGQTIVAGEGEGGEQGGNGGTNRIVRTVTTGDGQRPPVTPDDRFQGGDAIREHFRREADSAKV